uniref:Uncharacterized protein n=1 Tax=Noctiluca scintillans TaxID=2966 RepID=A0A7S1AYS3_NOCSC
MTGEGNKSDAVPGVDAPPKTSQGILATRGKNDKDSMTRIDSRGVFIEKGKKIHKISFQDEKLNTPVAEVKEVAQVKFTFRNDPAESQGCACTVQ